jgi:phage-related protein
MWVLKLPSSPCSLGMATRSADGINNVMQRWRLRFDDVHTVGGDAIVAFLIARAGWEAFDWTPKWATSAIRVICKEWNRSITRDNLSSIVCTFEQRFEP